MNATRLVEGYREVLNEIYACDPYYERVKLFLAAAIRNGGSV